MQVVPNHDKIVVLGDFNAVSGVEWLRVRDRSIRPRCNKRQFNTHAVLLFSTGLSVLGSWYQRKNIHRYTWLSNDGHWPHSKKLITFSQMIVLFSGL